MRAALGLVALLVTVAIILLLFKFYTAPMLDQSKTARQQARQIAGRDEEGVAVTNAVILDAVYKDGQMVAATVTDITPGSELQKHYGLQKGDVITDLGPLSIKGHISSPDEARDFLLDAYEKNQPIVVQRGWEQVSLPVDPDLNKTANFVTPPGTAAPATQPSAPQADAAAPKAPAKRPSKGAMERQLDLLKNTPQE